MGTQNLKDAKDALADLVNSDAYKKLSPDEQLQKLFNLAQPVDISATGKVTILYSGWANGNSSSSIAGEIAKNNLDARVLDKTDAFKFLVSDEYKTALARTAGLSFIDYNYDSQNGGIAPSAEKLAARAELNNKFFHGETGPWAIISKNFTAATVGDVRVIMGPGANPNGVFSKTEFATALLPDSKVTHINGTPIAKIRELCALDGVDEVLDRLKVLSWSQVSATELSVSNIQKYIDLTPEELIKTVSSQEGGSRILDDLRNPDKVSLEHKEMIHSKAKYLSKFGPAATVIGALLVLSQASAMALNGDTEGAKNLIVNFFVDAIGSYTVEIIAGVLVGAVAAIGVWAGIISAPFAAAATTLSVLLGGFFGGDLATEYYPLIWDNDGNGTSDALDRLFRLIHGDDHNALIDHIPYGIGGQQLKIESALKFMNKKDDIISDLMEKAKNSIEWRYAIRYLNPLVVTGLDYSKYNQNGELEFDAMSDYYWADRAQMLYWRLQYDKDKKNYGSTYKTNDEGNYDYVDHFQALDGSDYLTLAIDGGSVTKFDRQIVFGNDEGGEIKGSGGDDRLYGGIGKDTLIGKEGNDYLEGGRSEDTYIVGQGRDVIYDSDGKGKLYYNGQLLTFKEDKWSFDVLHNGWSYGANWIVEIEDNKQGGQNLIIKDINSPTNSVTIRNYEEGALGLSSFVDLENKMAVTYGTGAENPLYNYAKLNDAETNITEKWEGEQMHFGVFFRVAPKDGEEVRLTLNGFIPDGLIAYINSEKFEVTGNQIIFKVNQNLINGGLYIMLVSGGLFKDSGTFTINATYIADGKTLSSTANFEIEKSVIHEVDAYNKIEIEYAPITYDDQGNRTSNGDLDENDQPYRSTQGTETNDRFIGTDGDDWIIAKEGGQDRFEVGKGDDGVLAGDGNDILIGGDGRDVLLGGKGNDLLFAEDYRELTDETLKELQEGKGEGTGEWGEWLNGMDGNDTLVGSSSNDTLFGGAGNDLIMGGAGDDYILGDLSSAINSPLWHISDGLWTETDRNRYRWKRSENEIYSMIDSNDRLHGGAGNDRIWGDAGNDFIDGGEGSDYISGGSHEDVILGGVGDDELHGDEEWWPNYSTFGFEDLIHGNDVIHGGEGNDYIAGNGGNDQLFGDEGNDTVYGDQAASSADRTFDEKYYGNDYLSGGEGNDYLVGGGKDDGLNGGEGNDSLHGDEVFYGDKMFLEGELHGKDKLYGGAGNDRISGGGNDDIIYGEEGDDIIFGDLHAISDKEREFDISFKYQGNDYINGGDGNDIVYGGGGSDFILGGQGNDELSGGGYNNTQYESGNLDDTIDGGEGDDLIIGGQGNDILQGGLGSDTIYGDASDFNYEFTSGTFDDTIDGGEGDDVIYGGQGSDSIHGGKGNDRIYGDGTKELTQAGNYDDVIYGEEGDDTISGGQGNDRIYGGDGNDIIYGDEGDDFLSGGDGDDVLIDESGINVFHGGKGYDRFKAGSGQDTYIFNIGDAQGQRIDSSNNYTFETIYDTSNNNIIQFGAGITKDSIRFYKVMGRVLIQYGQSDAFFIDENTIEKFVFADGTSYAFIDLIEKETSNSENGGGSGGGTNNIPEGMIENYDRYILGSQKIGRFEPIFTKIHITDTIYLLRQTGWKAIDEYDGFNIPPAVYSKEIPTQFVYVDEMFSLALPKGYFIDVDNDQLTYTLKDTEFYFYYANNWLQLNVTPNALEIFGSTNGQTRTRFELTADDGRGGTASLNFDVVAGIRKEQQTEYADVIIGNQGGDTIVAGSGDIVYGRDGDDHFYLSDYSGYAIFYGGLGTDTYHVMKDQYVTIDDNDRNNILVLGEGFKKEDMRLYAYNGFYEMYFVETNTHISLSDATHLNGGVNLFKEIHFANGDVINGQNLGVVRQSGSLYDLHSNQLFMIDKYDIYDAELGNQNMGVGLTFLDAKLQNGNPLPDWMKFDVTTGSLSGIPPFFKNWANFTVTIKVKDKDGVEGYFDINFSIPASSSGNHAPEIAKQQQDISLNQNDLFIYQIPSDLFRDVDAADILSYRVMLANGDPLPAWLSYDAASRTLMGIPDNDQIGNLQLKIIATDPQGLSAEQSFKITINDINDAPIIEGSIDNIAIKMGEALHWSLPTAIFKDLDKGDVLSYSVSLADGSALPSWLHFDPVTGLLSGTPSKGHAGDLSIKVTATDKAGANVSTYFGLSVEALPNGTPTTQNLQSNLSLDQNQVWSYQLSAALFSDPDGDVLQYRVVLADGNPLPSWLHFDPDTRTLSGTPNNDQVGDLQLKIIATDQGDLSAEQSFNLTVNNVNDAPIVVGGIDDIVIKMGEVINWSLPTAIFKDIDKDDVLSYSVSLADGSALPSWLHFDPTTGLLSGTPSKSHAGDLSIKVTATDKAGANVSTYFGLSIEALPNNAPITQNTQANVSLDQNQVWSYQLSSSLFSDPDGDALQYRVVLADGNPLPLWLHFDPDTRTLSGTPDNDQVGNLQLKIIATDPQGLSAEQSFNLTVNNVNDAPIASGVLNNQSGRIDELWQFNLPNGSFTDIDKDDRLSYSLRMVDGSEVPAWLTIDAATGKISGKPDTIGMLNLQIVATDLSGAQAIHALKVDIKGGYNPSDIVGTNGNDTLTGTRGNDVFYGLGGNDRMVGSDGDDIYVFSKGHGQDVIYDYGYSSATETDTLIFTDVNSTEVKFGRISDNLVLFGYNGSDKITIENFFTSTQYSYAIEAFQFADKTITYDQYMTQGLPLYALDATSTITGWSGANIIHAGSGTKTINTSDANDVIYTETANVTVNAGNGNDTIYSGSGNDRLIGSNGSDTYIFAKGHGQDVIYDYGYSSATETDTLIFTDVNSTEVKFGRISNNLVLFGYNGSDKITIENFFTSTQYSYAIEAFQFADKTITYDQYMTQGLPLYALDATSTITGWSGANIIHAGSGTKTIITSDANDVIYTETANVTVNAGNGNDTIYSGSGNDRLIGSYGSDTYIFAKGHGQDVIYDYGYLSATETDTLIFTDVNSTEVKFGRSGNNLVLFGYNGADKITIEHFFTSTQYSYAIEAFKFADKTITYDDYMAQGLPLYALDATSTITGWSGANIIHAGSGTKTINTGDANDVIYTETANVTVNAGNGNDTIYSGSGNDRLIGSNGSDTYIFAKGHGQDVIYDYGYSSATDTDTLTFTDVNSTEVKFGRSGNNLVLFGYNGSDKITIEHFFTSTPYSYAIEVFKFADKTITYDDYMAQGLPLYALDATSTITGWSGANIIHAGSGTKNITTGNANNVIYTESSSGTVTAGKGQDTFYSGSGNSRLVGDDGSDTYIFAKGHGQDVIYDYGYSSATDTDILTFTDVNSMEVKFGRSGNNLVLFGYNGSDKITIEQFFTSTQYSYAIEVFQFADKSITYDELMKISIPAFTAQDQANLLAAQAELDAAMALNQVMSPASYSMEDSLSSNLLSNQAVFLSNTAASNERQADIAKEVQSLINAMASFGATEGSIHIEDQTYDYLTPITLPN